MGAKPKLLLFGGSGKLGQEISKKCIDNFDVIAPSHDICDVTNYEEVKAQFAKEKPDVVINTAAIVGIKECENNKDLAWDVNVIGALNIAKLCNEVKCRLVFVSTAVVFDGMKGNYEEHDTPSPMYYYAITKVAAEQSCMILENSAIVRLDLFSQNNFKYKKVLIDHYTSKIPMSVAAENLLLITKSGFTGVINIGQDRDTLFNILKPYIKDIEGITIHESSMPDFPKDISLDISLWKNKFGS